MKRDERAPGQMPIAYRGLADRLDRQGAPERQDPVLRRLVDEGSRIGRILDRATPPEAMGQAPVAPARGPMALDPEYVVDAGGMRRLVGHHFREVTILELICLRALERHRAKGEKAAFVPPFSWHQIAIAGDYRELVRLRSGSPMRCSSFEAGRSGGGGSGLFIDAYIDQGEALAFLQDRIGTGLAIKAGPDGRAAGRRDIPARALIDGVVLSDRQIPAVLRAYGWSDGGRVKARAQEALRSILDRMLGQKADNEAS